MFSLIITIIAIALVAALAVATIFYGGDILVSQKAKANAATLDSQTQQIFAASQAYYLDNNAWPANVAVLSVDGKYLKTSPVPPGSAYAALPPGLMNAAYADGAVTGALPELSPQQKAAYLASDSALMTDFRVEAADAAVLRTQLGKLDGQTDANGANLATKALQMMQREVAIQATGKPSLLDYTWPAAAAQNPRTRYLWIPSKVNKETCRAVNVQWRQTILIPDGYSATNGMVQCFGDDTAGYSYFWLSPGADPAQIVLPGQPSGGGGGTPPVDVCPNVPGDQATVPVGMGLNGGLCVPDVCSNIPGVQVAAPAGTVVVGGECTVQAVGALQVSGPIVFNEPVTINASASYSGGVVLTNSGATRVVLNDVGAASGNSDPFTVHGLTTRPRSWGSGTGCRKGLPLEAGASCTLEAGSVEFMPTTPGDKAEALNLSYRVESVRPADVAPVCTSVGEGLECLYPVGTLGAELVQPIPMVGVAEEEGCWGPDGEYIRSGQGKSFYKDWVANGYPSAMSSTWSSVGSIELVPVGTTVSCQSEVRTCTAGTLSGSFTRGSCAAASDAVVSGCTEVGSALESPNSMRYMRCVLTSHVADQNVALQWTEAKARNFLDHGASRCDVWGSGSPLDREYSALPGMPYCDGTLLANGESCQFWVSFEQRAVPDRVLGHWTDPGSVQNNLEDFRYCGPISGGAAVVQANLTVYQPNGSTVTIAPWAQVSLPYSGPWASNFNGGRPAPYDLGVYTSKPWSGWAYYGKTAPDFSFCTEPTCQSVGVFDYTLWNETSTEGYDYWYRRWSGAGVVDGGAAPGWSEWLPVNAFTYDESCGGNEQGFCEDSWPNTATICPQWDYTASGGTNDGCVRRRCDNPVVNAAYLPGC